jgi:hypothetical protein
MKAIKTVLLILLVFAFYSSKAQTANTAFNPVLQGYIDIEKALFADDGKAANKKAAELETAIKRVNTNKLEAGQKTAWTNYGEKLRYNAQHISESKSIDHQREHFVALSDAVFALLKNFKPEYTVYRQYCPMKKQYWLNASAAIQNPYYGKKMADCGKVTETIKGTVK